ncbi:MAG TPA: PAS domain-containing sensor histidine kinase, partial [Mesorhizobium sp.]|nr:PAS domain-containing sensor histidine kinase [Mesorhizobium sp.]
MTAGCERLVHPSVVDGSERARHRRLLGVLLASPFFAAFAVSQAYFAATSPALTAIFTAFAVFWSAALVTASTGRVRLAGIAVLYGSILPVGALFAGAGGGASPFAMMLTAFAFEAGWIWRTRRAIASGVVAAVAALLAGSLLPGVESGAVSGWHWLVPIAYAATVGVRIAALFGERANRSDADSVTLEDIMDAVVFRITGGGEVLDASAKARDMLRLAPELLLG